LNKNVFLFEFFTQPTLFEKVESNTVLLLQWLQSDVVWNR